jgi:hypothetical protein
MDSKTASYEKQEMALECIVEFCSTSNFMVDLYVNYDCDLYCTNLFENMCKFLYKVLTHTPSHKEGLILVFTECIPCERFFVYHPYIISRWTIGGCQLDCPALLFQRCC